MSNYFIERNRSKVDISQIFLAPTAQVTQTIPAVTLPGFPNVIIVPAVTNVVKPASTNYDASTTYYKNFGSYQVPDGTVSQQGICGYQILGQDIGQKMSAFYHDYSVGTYTFTPPAWCNKLNILMIGGGGGGGGGSVTTSFINDSPNFAGAVTNLAGKGGGGGGGGFAYISIPASTCSITVGGGGSGGLGGTSFLKFNGGVPDGIKGGDGGATTLSVNGTQIICNGGVGGQGGTYDYNNNSPLNGNGSGGSSGTITGSTTYNNSGSSGSGNPTSFIQLLTVNGNSQGRYVSLGGNSGYTTNGGQFPSAISGIGGGGNGGYPNVITDINNSFATGTSGIKGQDGYARIYFLV